MNVPRPAWRQFLLPALLMAGAGVGWFHGRSLFSVPPSGGLSIPKEALDFGEVWEQKGFVLTLPIENTSRTDVEITGFETSCQCSAIQPERLVIKSGERATVSLTLDLRRRREGLSAAGSEGLRPFRITFAAHVSDIQIPAPAILWQIRGMVRSILDFSPPALHFDETLVKGSDFQGQQARVRSHVALTGLTASCDPHYGSIKVLFDPELPFQAELIIEPSRSLPVGPFEFDAVVRPLTLQTPHPPAVAVPVHGNVVEDVRLVPAYLSFGACKSGDDIGGGLVLESRSGKEFEVQDVSVEPASFSIASDSFNSVTQRIDVTLRQVLPGAHVGRLLVTVSQGGRSYDVAATLGYQGLSASP